MEALAELPWWAIVGLIYLAIFGWFAWEIYHANHHDEWF